MTIEPRFVRDDYSWDASPEWRRPDRVHHVPVIGWVHDTCVGAAVVVPILASYDYPARYSYRNVEVPISDAQFSAMQGMRSPAIAITLIDTATEIAR